MKLSECHFGRVVQNRQGAIGRILLGLRRVESVEMQVEVHWVGSERSSYAPLSELEPYEQ